MQNPYDAETGCCPRFDPAPWDEKELQWDNKLFIKDKVFCLFHIPLGFGKTMIRCMGKLGKAKAFTPEPPPVLAEHTSPWNMDIYIEVPHEVPDAENVRMNGTFLSKVFEGPYKDERKWCQSMDEWVNTKGKKPKKRYSYYTTCPRCAKTYGKNYVVMLTQVDSGSTPG